MEKVLSFAVGDRVRYIGDDEHDKEHNPEGVITEATMETGSLKYGYNLNSWYSHHQFELIERATSESLQQVQNLINEEYGDDDSFDEDDEYPEEESDIDNSSLFESEDEDLSKYFDYLIALRDSGKVNMFGASPYLESEFGLSPKEAKDVVSAWIKSFERN